MINIFIHTKNSYLKHAIESVISDISIQSGIKNININKTSIESNFIFYEMEVGEIFLCHKIFKNKFNNGAKFIFLLKKPVIDKEKLPFCIRDSIFITNDTNIKSFTTQISSTIHNLQATHKENYLTKEISCIKCHRVSLSPSQIKVITALNSDIYYLDLAGELEISGKTVQSHTINIMTKFEINTKKELVKFSKLVNKLALPITIDD